MGMRTQEWPLRHVDGTLAILRLLALAWATALSPSAKAEAGMRFGRPLPPSALPDKLRLEDVLPVSDPVSLKATSLFLERGDKEGERYGPFEMADGTPVRLGRTLFDLRTDNRDSFFLVRRADGWTQGPFPAADGSVARLAGVELRVRRAPSSIIGRVSLEGVGATRVQVSLVKMEDETAARLVRMRVEFWQIEAELDERTARRRFDAPVIRDSSGRTIFEPVVNRSGADIARATATAARNARENVEIFLRESQFQSVACDAPRGTFAFSALPPGRYFVCLIAEARDPESGRIPRIEPRFWWADVELDLHETAEVVFEGTGRSWKNLYP